MQATFSLCLCDCLKTVPCPWRKDHNPLLKVRFSNLKLLNFRFIYLYKSLSTREPVGLIIIATKIVPLRPAAQLIEIKLHTIWQKL